MSDGSERWHNKSLEYFHDNRIELHQELRNHPELILLLQDTPQQEFEEILLHVAAYCEVIVEGEYMPQDFDKLCGILRDKLIEKRVGIVFAREEDIK